MLIFTHILVKFFSIAGGDAGYDVLLEYEGD
jgi:hypothetical protein